MYLRITLEQEASIAASCARIEKVADRLVKRGVPASRIAIGGFSMGGGIALQAALRSKRRFAGVFALSSYLCENAAVYGRLAAAQDRLTVAASDDEDAALLSLPIFMRHGAADKFILPAWGGATAAQLATLGLSVNADVVPGLAHDLADKEVVELTAWLIRILTDDVIAQRGDVLAYYD
jgi:predicted esterase